MMPGTAYDNLLMQIRLRNDPSACLSRLPWPRDKDLIQPLGVELRFFTISRPTNA